MTNITQRRINGQAQTEARNVKLMADKAALIRDVNGQRAEMQMALNLLPVTAANKSGRATLQAALNYRAAQQTPRKTRATT